MPEKTNSASSQPANEEAKEPKSRRVSSKLPRKAGAKKEPNEAKEPKPDVKSDRGTNPDDSGNSSGKGKQQEAKRPNRRRRGKGKSQGKDSEKESQPEDPIMEKDGSSTGDGEKGDASEKLPTRESSRNDQRPPQKPRHKADAGKVAKNAWKIYLAEVSEEGVALIGDNDARELARRCFRLSEIFLEEEDRRN